MYNILEEKIQEEVYKSNAVAEKYPSNAVVYIRGSKYETMQRNIKRPQHMHANEIFNKIKKN